jgi:hypothetical protein
MLVPTPRLLSVLAEKGIRGSTRPRRNCPAAVNENDLHNKH